MFTSFHPHSVNQCFELVVRIILICQMSVIEHLVWDVFVKVWNKNSRIINIIPFPMCNTGNLANTVFEGFGNINVIQYVQQERVYGWILVY